MENTEDAIIQFLPVCSNCHKLIKKPIKYGPSYGYFSKVEPDYCPNCGSYFIGITMPDKLPFNTEDFIDMNENTKTEKVDNVNHPSHYADHCSLECFSVMKCVLGPSGAFQFCLGNAFKYLWRHKFKNGEEDVDKAGWYLTKANQLYSEYKDNELFIEEKNKLDQMMELYKMTKSGYME